MPPVFRDEEIGQFWRYIESSLTRLMTLVSDEPQEVLAWLPPADEANSILGLARHSLANASDNILGVIAGQPVGREREADFQHSSSAALLETWRAFREASSTALSEMKPGLVDQLVRHGRRGEVARREVFIVVARHVAEHLGQAELTRDLARCALAGVRD